MNGRCVRGLVAVVVLMSTSVYAQARRPDFSGTWTYDMSQTRVAQESSASGVVPRISWPAQLTIRQTPAELQIDEASYQQLAVSATYRLDGREGTIEADNAGITVRAKATWQEDSLVIDSVRTFPTPHGPESVNLRKVLNVSGDLLTVERTESGKVPFKVVYHRGTAADRVAKARPPRPSRIPTGAIPRRANGNPDFEGYWTARAESAADAVEPHPASFAVGGGDGVIIDPEDGLLPLQAWVAHERQRRTENLMWDPEPHCFLSGVPRQMYVMPYQIIMSNEALVILHEYVHAVRIIHMSKASHSTPNIKLWEGDSLGRWDGDTLVVDTANLNGKTWLDMAGDVLSDAQQVTERFWLIDADTIGYEATIDDPKVYTRPWTMAFTIGRNKENGYEILESACHEDNRDLERLKVIRISSDGKAIKP